ncbi:MAG TPA: hypothetical protein VIW47_16040 [Nitrospiraceae bacterium]|jgi:hypothetical protein
MELVIIIGFVILAVWLIPTLHKIRRRDQEETDKKIAFAKWVNEQQDPHMVSMVQDLLREKRFKTWEEAAKYVEQTPHTNIHANDKEGTPS